MLKMNKNNRRVNPQLRTGCCGPAYIHMHSLSAELLIRTDMPQKPTTLIARTYYPGESRMWSLALTRSAAKLELTTHAERLRPATAWQDPVPPTPDAGGGGGGGGGGSRDTRRSTPVLILRRSVRLMGVPHATLLVRRPTRPCENNCTTHRGRPSRLCDMANSDLTWQRNGNFL